MPNKVIYAISDSLGETAESEPALRQANLIKKKLILFEFHILTVNLKLIML